MAENYGAWGWSGSGYSEWLYASVELTSYNTARNESNYKYRIWNNSYNSYGETGTINLAMTAKYKDGSTTRKVTKSLGNQPTTGNNQIKEYASGTFTIQHYADGTLGDVIFTVAGDRALGNVLSTSFTIKLHGNTINRVGYLSGTPASIIANDGFNAIANERTSGLTYEIALYGDDSSTTLAGYRGISPGASRKINFTPAELKKIYDYLKSPSGRTCRIYLRTMSGSTFVGYEYKSVTVKPKPYSFGSPKSVTLGTAIVLSPYLTHTTMRTLIGLVKPDAAADWIPGAKILTNAGVSSVTIPTNTLAFAEQIFAIDPLSNPVNIFSWGRQYNEATDPLGDAKYPIEIWIPAVTMSHVITPGLTEAHMAMTFSNLSTSMDKLEWSFNGGEWRGLANGMSSSSYQHIIPNLNPNTEYKVRYRWTQKKATRWHESSQIIFRTLVDSTLSVNPTVGYSDSLLVITTTAAPNVKNKLSIKRMSDGRELYSNVNWSPGNGNYRLNPAELDDHFVDGKLTVRLTLQAFIVLGGGNRLQTTKYVDVILEQNGVVLVKKNNAWVKAQAKIRQGLTEKRAIPYVLRNNLMSYEQERMQLWSKYEGTEYTVKDCPESVWTDGYAPNVLRNSNFANGLSSWISTPSEELVAGKEDFVVVPVKIDGSTTARMIAKGSTEVRNSGIFMSDYLDRIPGFGYSMNARVFINDINKLDDEGISLTINAYTRPGGKPIKTYMGTISKSELKNGWNDIRSDLIMPKEAPETIICGGISIIKNGDIYVTDISLTRSVKSVPYEMHWDDMPINEKTSMYLRTVGGSQNLKIYITLTDTTTNDKLRTRRITAKNVGKNVAFVQENEVNGENVVLNVGEVVQSVKSYNRTGQTGHSQIRLSVGEPSHDIELYLKDLQYSWDNTPNNWVKTKTK